MNNKDLIYIFLAVFILLSVSFVSSTDLNATIFTPANNTWNTTDSLIQFDFSCNGNVSYFNSIAWNATLWFTAPNNGTWVANRSFGNITGGIMNDTRVNISFRLPDNNWTLWHIECVNVSGGWDGGVSSLKTTNTSVRTLRKDTVAPAIVLSVPADGTWNISNKVFPAATCTEINLFNFSLFMDGARNTSNVSAITSGALYNFSVLALGNSYSHLWNAYCCEASHRCTLAAANFTIRVDANAPGGGEITMPRVTSIYAQNPIKIKCSGEDGTSGIHYVALKITKPSGKVIEYTLSSDEEKILQGVDTGEAGKNLVDCTIYDQVGNSFSTEQKQFNVYHRTVHSAEGEVTPTEEITPEGEEITTPTEGGAPVEGGEAPSKAWIWIVIIVVVVGIIYFVLKKKR